MNEEKMSYEELEMEFDRMKTARDGLLLRVAKLRAERTWVGLTDEEKDGKQKLKSGLLFNSAEVQVWELAVDWAEAKLKERNT